VGPDKQGSAYRASKGQVRSDAERREAFVALFRASFEPLCRYLNRLAGDVDLASDLAQEAFVRLYRRPSLPDDPNAWLFTVATNLFRNAKTKRGNRARLLSRSRGLRAHSDPLRAPDEHTEAGEERRRVRVALDRMAVRERSILLLAAEGYSYREIATIVDLREASVGTLLRRAKDALRRAYELEFTDAP
jgi:RNA polymerase sigma-70 factor (ECF subfamily)